MEFCFNQLHPAEFLPSIVKKQVLACSQMPVTGNFNEAVKSIREASEGGEVYVLALPMGKEKYSVIRYYGGGNPTGCIFKWGESKIHAMIGDDDIACTK